MDKTQTVSLSQLEQDLRKLGLQAGQLIMVHAAPSQVGYLEGGADALLDLLLSIIGTEGTLMAPTFTYSYNLREGAVPYDPKTTPSFKNGSLADRLWQRKGAYRSSHPAYSVAAIGKMAKAMTENHPIDRPVGEGSPLHRLILQKGFVLLLGVGLEKCTLVHTAEALCNLGYTHIPFKESWGRQVLVQTPQGIKPIPQTDFSGCSFGFPILQPFLNKQEMVRLGLVGYAPSQFFKAESLLIAVKEAVKGQLDFLLCRRAECEACTNRRGYLKQMGRIK